MRRKIITLSDSTYVVTLPIEWIRTHGVKKGDDINLEENSKGLIISLPHLTSSEKRQVKINITNLEERVIRWQLSALHKTGYDEIEILLHPSQKQLIYELMKDLFTGFNVTSETENSVCLKSISIEDKNEFDAALRRAFRITILMGQELWSYLEENEYNLTKLNTIKEKELLNNQLTNFCQRLINKNKIVSKNTTFIYTVAWNLEKVCDNYKYIINHILNNQEYLASKEILELFKQVNNYLEDYYNLFYDFNIVKLNDINKSMQNFKKIITKQKNDLLSEYLFILITQINDFSASIIALNVNSF
jgi:phosphate uptake regulator